jgi:hypothetical protein
MTLRCLAAAALTALSAAVLSAMAQPVPSDALARLIAAYPNHLERIEDNVLVWKDGTRMVIDEGRQGRDHDTMLATADIKDSVALAYPLGKLADPPARNVDPGRARHAALFDKMYGNCMKGEVAKHLVDVPWLPSKGGGSVKVSSITGVATKLAAVSRDLDALPAIGRQA